MEYESRQRPTDIELKLINVHIECWLFCVLCSTHLIDNRNNNASKRNALGPTHVLLIMFHPIRVFVCLWIQNYIGANSFQPTYNMYT